MPTVLITGTSTGIGRVTAEVLAQRGWHVFASMRDLEKRDKLEAARNLTSKIESSSFSSISTTPLRSRRLSRRFWREPAGHWTLSCRTRAFQLPAPSRICQGLKSAA